MNRKVLVIISTLVVYLLSAGISYTFFARTSPSSNQVVSPVDNKKTGNDYQAITFDDNGSKTEACPLNGVLYTTQQKDWWEKHRPLGVMIENHLDARPQSGISFADVTYEAVAEGGITRTLNVYYCQDAGIVGPVRSARTYFLDFISEYGDYPLYAHVGGANTPGPADALGQIDDYGWSLYNDLNQFSIGFPTYWRDENRLGHDVATEHTMYSTTSKLWAVGVQRGLTNVDKKGKSWNENFVPYSFKDDAVVSERPENQSIHLDFAGNASYASDYAVDWTYDKTNNVYLRNNGGKAHVDRNTNKQLSTKNLVILFMRMSQANDGYENNLHTLYGTKGTGKALIFMDGKEMKGTWQKDGRTSRTLLTVNGSEVKFDRGKIWFEIQPLNGVIDVK